MSTHKHHWRTVDPYDGGLHYCRKCDRWAQGERPDANDCPVSDTEHGAAAWLGQAGLYPTRLDAVRNGEQRLEPVSAEELFQHARRYVHLTRRLGMGFKAPRARITKTPNATDAAIDQDISTREEARHA